MQCGENCFESLENLSGRHTESDIGREIRLATIKLRLPRSRNRLRRLRSLGGVEALQKARRQFGSCCNGEMKDRL